MKRGGVVLLLVLFSLGGALADIDLQIPCTNTMECLTYCGWYQWECSCQTTTATCVRITSTSLPGESEASAESAVEENFLGYPESHKTNFTGLAGGVENVTISSASSAVPLVASAEWDALRSQVDTLDQRTQSLENSLAQTQQDVTQVQKSLSRTQGDVQQLQVQQQGLEQELQGQLRTVATGLAGLQQDVDTTQQEVVTLGQSVESAPTLLRIIGYVLLVVGGIAVAGGIFYLTLKAKRPQRQVSQDIIQYITRHIKAGKKFSHIRQQLLQAGWSPDEVHWAYKETAHQNYQ